MGTTPASRPNPSPTIPRRARTVAALLAAALLPGLLAAGLMLAGAERSGAPDQRTEDAPAGAEEPDAHAPDHDMEFPGYEDFHPLGPDHQAHVIVYPAEPGTNDVRLHLMDLDDATADIAEEVEMRFSMPDAGITPITRTPRDAGPGTYVHTGDELEIPGVWEIEVRVLVGDSEPLTATAEVEVGDETS